MIDEASYAELDRYFHSRMNAGESSAFVSRMNADEELRAEFQWLNTMLGGMKQQGRSVMKHTIASAIAGIPAKDIEKYEPTINRKSFFKKYGWVITGAIAVIGVAVAIYFYTTSHNEHDHPSDNNEAVPREELRSGDSAPGASINQDKQSGEDFRSAGGNADSIFKTQNEGRTAVRETVDVIYRSGNYLYGERKTGTPKVGQNKVDTTRHALVWAGAEDEDDEYRKKEKTRGMGVTTGYKPYPPYTYKLDDDLMLNAPYYTCTGFTWEGMGTDTVYMTTKDGVKYMLLRGRGVQELKPLTTRK